MTKICNLRAVTDEHPNALLLRTLYDAYARRDREAICELIADDCQWNIPGRGPNAGTHVGIDAILELFRGLMRASEGSAVIELHDVLANDTTAVAIQTGRAKIDGRESALQEVLVHTVRDGKIVSMQEYQFDLYAFDEMMG
jgi:ketosteroid isomerase-like protein